MISEIRKGIVHVIRNLGFRFGGVAPDAVIWDERLGVMAPDARIRDQRSGTRK